MGAIEARCGELWKGDDGMSARRSGLRAIEKVALPLVSIAARKVRMRVIRDLDYPLRDFVIARAPGRPEA
jgi:hypothetical protein